MPSPIAHTVTAAYLMQRANRYIIPDFFDYLGIFLFSYLPDMDYLEPYGFSVKINILNHHNYIHSFAVGFIAAIIWYCALAFKDKSFKKRCFYLPLLAYWLHISLDQFGVDLIPENGMGSMLFYPFSESFYKVNMILFPLVPSPENLGFNLRNIGAAVSETAIISIIYALYIQLLKLPFIKKNIRQ